MPARKYQAREGFGRGCEQRLYNHRFNLGLLRTAFRYTDALWDAALGAGIRCLRSSD